MLSYTSSYACPSCQLLAHTIPRPPVLQRAPVKTHWQAQQLHVAMAQAVALSKRVCRQGRTDLGRIQHRQLSGRRCSLVVLVARVQRRLVHSIILAVVAGHSHRSLQLQQKTWRSLMVSSPGCSHGFMKCLVIYSHRLCNAWGTT